MSAAGRQILACVWLAAAHACAGPDLVAPVEDEPTSRRLDPIIQGEPIAETEFPATGAILRFRRTVDGKTSGGFLCTGTLIAPDIVLTAAHCLPDLDAEPSEGEDSGTDETLDYFTLDTDLTALSRPNPGLPRTANRVTVQVRHPEFNKTPQPSGLAQFNDLGLVVLASPIQHVPPARVSSSARFSLVEVGEPVEIVGYGLLTEEGHDYGIKRGATAELGEIGAFELKVGDASKPRKCFGDSGGPSYLADPRHRAVGASGEVLWTLVGVTSRAYSPRGCYDSSIDARVDAYRDWVIETLMTLCDQGVRNAETCATEPGLPCCDEDPPQPNLADDETSSSVGNPNESTVPDAGASPLGDGGTQGTDELPALRPRSTESGEPDRQRPAKPGAQVSSCACQGSPMVWSFNVFVAWFSASGIFVVMTMVSPRRRRPRSSVTLSTDATSDSMLEGRAIRSGRTPQ